MRNFFTGVGEIIAGVIGWFLLVVIVLALLGITVIAGVAALGIVVVVVAVGIIVGAIRKMFGIKSKPKVIRKEVR